MNKPYDGEYMKITHNGPSYYRNLNPYEKMVNLSMNDNSSNLSKFSFRSKAFYQRAVELSQNPSAAKINDRHNPIFFFIADQNEYRYYKLDNNTN
jgi:hypothetical protein